MSKIFQIFFLFKSNRKAFKGKLMNNIEIENERLKNKLKSIKGTLSSKKWVENDLNY